MRDAYARYQGGEQSFRDQFVTLFMETPALLAAAGLRRGPRPADADSRGRETATAGTVAVAARLTPLEGEAALRRHPQLLEAAASLPPDGRGRSISSSPTSLAPG